MFFTLMMFVLLMIFSVQLSDLEIIYIAFLLIVVGICEILKHTSNELSRPRVGKLL